MFNHTKKRSKTMCSTKTTLHKQFNKAILHYPYEGTLHEKSKCLRPSFLNILRNFEELGEDYDWCIFMHTLYTKIIIEFLPALIKEINDYVHLDRMNSLEDELIFNQDIWTLSWRLELECRYMKKFRNNILSFKKKCEDLTIEYYYYLPGNKLPLDIRSHIVSFISPIPLLLK